MNHDSLRRKLALLEGEILPAQSQSLPGNAMLPGIALTLDVAIRVAASIRDRLAGVVQPAGKQLSPVGSGSLTTD